MSRATDARRCGLRWFGAVRVRAAIASMIIVGLALALGALGVIGMLSNSLVTSVTNVARAEALDISSFITNRNAVPLHLSTSAGETAAQIVTSDGRVLTSSPNISGEAAMAKLDPGPDRQSTDIGVVLRTHPSPNVDPNLDKRFVVEAVGFTSPGYVGTVLVAQSLGAADHAIGIVTLTVEIVLPLITLLIGLLVWLLEGWALRPVEAIRAEVAKISATDLRRRVPEQRVPDEIGRLATTMNVMLTRLETSGRRQRQLVADVSHELRNPLAALQAQLEIAAAHPGPGSQSLLEGSLVEVQRMTQLVEELLILARLDEGTLHLRVGAVDLDELALQAADRLRLRGRVDVSVQGVRASRIAGDEAQLTRVIANLADNAERHARRLVTFTISERADAVELAVTDDGRGVPADERERIFERFVRLDAARTHSDSGAGLGLAIVREIVTAHGGRVWSEEASPAASPPGSRFVVRLPRNELTPETASDVFVNEAVDEGRPM